MVSSPVMMRTVLSSGNSTTEGPSSSNGGLVRQKTFMFPETHKPVIVRTKVPLGNSFCFCFLKLSLLSFYVLQ